MTLLHDQPTRLRWSLGFKLTLVTSLLVSLILGGLVGGIAWSTTRLLEEQAIAQISDQAKSVKNMISLFSQAVQSSVQRFSKMFADSFTESFSLDTAHQVQVGGQSTPLLRHGGTALNGDFSIPDRFTGKTGVSATIFVRRGEDFVRISTSVKKESGERAVGTLLDRRSPAYARLQAGESYSGLAQLFGRHFITDYAPIRSSDGKVIGALYVGVDISSDMAVLKERIRSLKIGETGYFYVLDQRPGKDSGTLLVHPSKEGSNIIDATDSNGHAFVRDMLERGQGVIRYPWINKERGETTAREKIVAYDSFPDWGWLVAGGAYAEEITREFAHLRNIYLGAALLGTILLVAALFLAIRQMIARPLADASALARQIATGDLTGTLAVQHHDEIGTLVTAMNGISRGLMNVVERVRSGCDQIATASNEIAEGNRDLSNRTEQQAANLEETASSVEEITATIRQNADNAAQASQLALSASGLATQGGQLVNRVMTTMGEIDASSRHVASIITLIDEIAFQTNILALNAAVEAARAGAQGRGFAVVAGEVRALAARSASAAQDIKSLIGGASGKIAEGSALAGEAGSMMEEIIASVGRVADIIGEISAASHQQSTGVEQVNDAIAHIDQGTQQNAALVEQAAAAATSLAQQSAELLDSVKVFRLTNQTTGNA